MPVLCQSLGILSILAVALGYSKESPSDVRGLVALLVQFVVSFAHIRRNDLVPVGSENLVNASRLNLAIPDNSPSSAPARDHDLCQHAARWPPVLPQPQAAVITALPHKLGPIRREILHVSADQHPRLTARGPST